VAGSSKISGDDRAADAVPALRDADGDARPDSGRTLEGRSILGLPSLRATFLDHPRGAAAGGRGSEIRLTSGPPHFPAGSGRWFREAP
jgi:hypothetical protein